MKKYNLCTPLVLLGMSFVRQAQEDNYLWLEEVDGEKALQFAEKQNQATVTELSTEKALGNDFNIKAIHNTILDAGDMPPPVLEQRVRAWIEDGGK